MKCPNSCKRNTHPSTHICDMEDGEGIIRTDNFKKKVFLYICPVCKVVYAQVENGNVVYMGRRD